MTNKKVIIDGVEYVPKVEGVEAKEWPRDGDEYYLINEEGVVFKNTWQNDNFDQERLEIGNCFPTEQKAEYERLRRECMATRWIPKEGDVFYCYEFCGKFIDSSVHLNLWQTEFILGLAAPTKEEAQARWDMYGEAWLDALKS